MQPITELQRESLTAILDYLADEENHYESCEESEQENHIWKHREIVRDMLESQNKQSVPATAIIVMEGGVVQNAYCPNPAIELEYIVVDYDLDEWDDDGLKDLIEALESAHAEEQKYDYQPSISGTLQEKRDKLTKLTQETSEQKASLCRVSDLCGMDTDTLEQSLSILQEELRKRDNASVMYDIWHLEDIKSRRPDLTDDECRKVMTFMEHRHDCTIGINWDFVDAIADDLFPEPDNIHELREKYRD